MQNHTGTAPAPVPGQAGRTGDAGLGWLTGRFAPITLEALNGKAEMLSRIDNKYILHADRLQQALPELAAHFDILEIDGRRAFAYETRYFDDARRSAYHEHHQGRRRGFKVRIRRYLDAGLAYLEVKVKGRRGMTENYRMPCAAPTRAGLSPAEIAFARTTYSTQYGKPFTYELEHALDIRYRRITLVARDGGERMTIDAELQFRAPGAAEAADPDALIIETKSANGRGRADRCLRSVGARVIRRCSKYCIGMAATGQVDRCNRFLPAMRRLGLGPGRCAPASGGAPRSDLGPIPARTKGRQIAAPLAVG